MPSDTPTKRMNSAAAKRNSSAKQTTTPITTRLASRMRRPFQLGKAAWVADTRSPTVSAIARVIDRGRTELIFQCDAKPGQESNARKLERGSQAPVHLRTHARAAARLGRIVRGDGRPGRGPDDACSHHVRADGGAICAALASGGARAGCVPRRVGRRSATPRAGARADDGGAARPRGVRARSDRGSLTREVGDLRSYTE